MRPILTALLILTSSVALAADGLPRVRSGVPYLAEAVRLTDAQWRPITLDDAEGCGHGDGRCTLRPEVRACSGDPLGTCSFTWLRNNRIIEVVTIGRDPARVVRIRCGAAC